METGLRPRGTKTGHEPPIQSVIVPAQLFELAVDNVLSPADLRELSLDTVEAHGGGTHAHGESCEPICQGSCSHISRRGSHFQPGKCIYSGRCMILNVTHDNSSFLRLRGLLTCIFKPSGGRTFNLVVILYAPCSCLARAGKIPAGIEDGGDSGSTNLDESVLIVFASSFTELHIGHGQVHDPAEFRDPADMYVHDNIMFAELSLPGTGVISWLQLFVNEICKRRAFEHSFRIGLYLLEGMILDAFPVIVRAGYALLLKHDDCSYIGYFVGTIVHDGHGLLIQFEAHVPIVLGLIRCDFERAEAELICFPGQLISVFGFLIGFSGYLVGILGVRISCFCQFIRVFCNTTRQVRLKQRDYTGQAANEPTHSAVPAEYFHYPIERFKECQKQIANSTGQSLVA